MLLNLSTVTFQFIYRQYITNLSFLFRKGIIPGLIFPCLILISTTAVDAKKRIDVSKEAESKNTISHPPSRRMMMMSVDILSEVPDCGNAILQLQETVAGVNGFIISSVTTPSKQRRNTATVVFRVPAVHVDGIMKELDKLSTGIISKSISGNDVSDEYARISSQLTNQKSTGERRREILKSAKKTEEVIAVEKYFTAVRDEIARLEAERQSLADKVMLTTIKVSFQQTEQNGKREYDDDSAAIGTGVGRNMTGAANILDKSIAFLISAVPVVLFLLVPGFFLFKLAKKYRLVKKDE